MRRDKAARSRVPDAHRSTAHDRWLVSYADLITLMFAFFTVMYAISTVDADKLTPAANSLQSAFATVPGPASAVVAGEAKSERPTPVMAPVRVTASSATTLDHVRRRLDVELADAVESGRLDIAEDVRGLVLSLPVEATFASGSADVQPDARALIARLAAALQPLGNAVRIEGHTDDLPIHTPRYGSNWELSTARASAVVAFLIDTAHVSPARLSAAGYGEFHPRVPNDSTVNRARNRRVDIVVLNAAALEDEPARQAFASAKDTR